MLKEKTDNKKQFYALFLIGCLLCSLGMALFINYVTYAPAFALPVNTRLLVSISPRDVKLAVGEDQIFTALVEGGMKPYSYVWRVNGTIYGENNNAIIFHFEEPCNFITLSVDVTDDNGDFGYAFTTVYDPITITAGSFADTAAYVLSIDGSTYYAKSGITGQVTSSSNSSALIATIGASGGQIFVKDGTYTVTHSWVLQNDTDLIAQSKNTILYLANSAECPLITSNSSSNIKISGFYLDGNSANQAGGTGVSGIRFEGVYGFLIENIYIEDTYHQGIDIVDESCDGKISYIETHQSGSAGIYIGYESHTIDVTNVYLYDSGQGSGSGSDTDGLIVAGELNGYCHDITLLNIHVSNPARYGISLWDTEYVSGSHIYITGADDWALYLTRGNHYIDLAQVSVNNNAKRGIVIMAGNQAFADDAANHHIKIQGTSNNNGEEGVYISGFLPTYSYPYPYHIDLSVNVVNNQNTGIGIAGYNDTYRIHQVMIHDCFVQDNSLAGTGWYNGILLYQAQACSVLNIQINGTDQAWGLYENVNTGGYNTIGWVNAWEGNTGGIGNNTATTKVASCYNITTWVP